MNSGAKKDCVILMILAILTASILAYALYIPTLNANAFQSRIENLTLYEEVTYLGYVHLTTVQEKREWTVEESQAYKVNSNEFMDQVGEEGNTCIVWRDGNNFYAEDDQGGFQSSAFTTFPKAEFLLECSF